MRHFQNIQNRTCTKQKSTGLLLELWLETKNSPKVPMKNSATGQKSLFIWSLFLHGVMNCFDLEISFEQIEKHVSLCIWKFYSLSQIRKTFKCLHLKKFLGLCLNPRLQNWVKFAQIGKKTPTQLKVLSEEKREVSKIGKWRRSNEERKV